MVAKIVMLISELLSSWRVCLKYEDFLRYNSKPMSLPPCSYKVEMLLRKAAHFIVCLWSVWFLYEGSSISQKKYFVGLKLLSEMQ